MACKLHSRKGERERAGRAGKNWHRALSQHNGKQQTTILGKSSAHWLCLSPLMTRQFQAGWLIRSSFSHGSTAISLFRGPAWMVALGAGKNLKRFKGPLKKRFSF